MSVTIPLLTTIPSSSTMTEAEYNTSWNTLLSELDPYANAANALAVEVEANAADAEAAVAALASAKWVSGTYTEGDVAWSPTDYFNYRCKNTGSRTTDPALDPTNWALQTKTGAGGSDTTSSAVDITLTSTSGRLQIIAMTAAGKKVTQPAANTLLTGALIFVYVNNGIYRFAVHKNGGGFLCYVNPGQVVAVHCSDMSSGPGKWHVSGQNVDQIYGGNTAEVLNAVSSGYAAAAMLTATKAIAAFRNNSTTHLEVVVLNYGSASGSPVEINAEASTDISIDAQTSSQATVVYKTSTGVTKGYVIDISGNTPTPGAVRTIDSGTGGNGTSLAALSSTQLLCLYQGGTSGTLRERILDISASAIAESAEVVADATTAYGTYLSVKKVSASKALVAFRDTSKAPVLRLQTITGSVPAPSGSPVTVTHSGTPPSTHLGLSVLGASRAVLIQGIDRTFGDMLVSLIDISGSSPVLLANKKLSPGTFSDASMDATKLGANSVYLTWQGAAAFGVSGMVLTITADDRIIEGVVADKLEPGVSGRLACAALDSSHVMQVCGNADTYLSAKTLEIAA